MTIDKTTHLTVGLAITMIVAAITFGIMLNKVENLSTQVTTLQSQVTVLNSKVDQIIGKLGAGLIGKAP